MCSLAYTVYFSYHFSFGDLDLSCVLLLLRSDFGESRRFRAYIFHSLSFARHFLPAFNFKEFPHMYALSKPHFLTHSKTYRDFWWDQIDNVINYRMNFRARNIFNNDQFRNAGLLKTKYHFKMSCTNKLKFIRSRFLDVVFGRKGAHFKFKCVQQFRCKISSWNTRKIHSNLVWVKRKFKDHCVKRADRITFTILPKSNHEIWWSQNGWHSHIRFQTKKPACKR